MADKINPKHEAVLLKAAAAIRARGHEGDARLADSVAGVLASMRQQANSRAALASRPTEVDDEGLPPLPPSDPELVKRFGPPTYTAEQYRQGQRDAIAADRARRGQD